MNVILFIKNLQGRGVSKVYLNLAKELKKANHNPYIILRENIIDFDTKGLEITILKDNYQKNLDEFISKNSIKFIISNNVKYLQGIKNLDNNKIFFTVHMLWGERIFKKFRFKKLFELKKEYKNKNVIAVSNAVKNDLINKIKIKPKKIEVIHDIFDFEDIQTKSDEFIPEYQDYILFVGSLTKEKRPLLAIKTFEKLNTDLKFIIIGKGKLENKLKQYVKQKNLEKKVLFLGFKKNPYPYIKNAKLTVMTSSNEALPGVAIESLFLNTPVVSTDSVGIRDILTDELSSFIVNKTQLKNAMLKALYSYPEINVNKLVKKFHSEPVKKYISLMERK